MLKLKVLNEGSTTRFRLGVEFPPNKETTITVSKKQYITVKAVKDFKIIEEQEIQQENNDNGSQEQNNSNDESQEQNDANASTDFNFEDLNVEESLKAVENGEISVNEAIALESANKNRSTLLDQLEDMKEDE